MIVLYQEAFIVAIARMKIDLMSKFEGDLVKIFGRDCGFSFLVPDAVAQKITLEDLLVLVYIPSSDNSFALETLAVIRENEGKAEVLMGDEGNQGKWIELYKMKARSARGFYAIN